MSLRAAVTQKSRKITQNATVEQLYLIDFMVVREGLEPSTSAL
jgi:hypothetical protein